MFPRAISCLRSDRGGPAAGMYGESHETCRDAAIGRRCSVQPRFNTFFILFGCPSWLDIQSTSRKRVTGCQRNRTPLRRNNSLKYVMCKSWEPVGCPLVKVATGIRAGHSCGCRGILLTGRAVYTIYVSGTHLPDNTGAQNSMRGVADFC